MYDEITFEECKYSKDPIISCALEGVASVVAGIKEASVVIHSPQGCAATVGTAYDKHEVDFTKRKIGCTRLFESDVILGASEKLVNLIKEADSTFNSKVMFVIGTCAADIIGEDIEGICREVQSNVNARLIPIMAGGFRGNSYDGLNIGLNSLLPLIKKFDVKNKKSVNIVAPQANSNPTWWSDLKWVIDIFEKLGIKVQTVLSKDMSIFDLRNAGKASANIVLSHDAGYEFAQEMQRIHGIPLILDDIPLPIGLKNTARWLRRLGEYFDVSKEVDTIVKMGEKKVMDLLRKRALMMIPRYHNCKIVLSADATMGIGLIRMLFEELEMIPEVILIRSDIYQSRNILKNELRSLGISSAKVAFGVDGYQIKEVLKNTDADAVFGSAWEKYMAKEVGIRIAFDVLSPTNLDIYVDKPYFGYDGMLNILEVVANDWERAFRSKEIDSEQYSYK
ncbi:nitrogenase component 1 [Clostridium luticellarii]|uniref:Nitrogenase iron-iron protein beta chain n=1 Tax=Clostridium luticellarii TaxID=1691940 RepID=A0A2T0BA50_9CLOT|nr:nitrogenase component 1 [Clostridium luticellarii]MCI1945703.1 nitrogenase associated protein N [Clostridium luticellarii]MCI1969062.1 nitrogenase associated protein N [Clostridium luticellarii]MCI1996074.1 nitrogenase associated protein N [Clostridium luticellarii]MCI2040439.1 nitrogenase associated protein N [Clostridium luticellarii]PRR80768.1 Nitrogenase iron-iron protein beta chain [Clostridium luticellarii]